MYACSNWQYNKQSLRHTDFQIISVSFKNTFLFIFSTASTNSELLNPAVLLTPCDMGKQLICCCERTFNPCLFLLLSKTCFQLGSIPSTVKHLWEWSSSQFLSLAEHCQRSRKADKILPMLSINQNRRKYSSIFLSHFLPRALPFNPGSQN